MKISKNLKKLKTLQNVSNKKFSYIYNNFPVVHQYYYNGKHCILDTNIEQYNKLIEAFLTKRWTTKQEIPAKIKILNYDFSSSKVLMVQKVQELKKIVQVDEDVLRFQYDHGYIDRNYIMNVLLEKNEIELNRQILNKLIINGYVIKLEDNEKNINFREKIDNLVQIFYKGDKLTAMEKSIQTLYLTYKFRKYISYKSSKLPRDQSIFTDKDMHNAQGYIECPNYKKPKTYQAQEHYNPAEMLKTWKMVNTEASGKLHKLGYLLTHNKHQYGQVYKLNLVAKNIINYISSFMNSEEFSKNFDTDLNFYISHAIYSMHIWLICQRLQQFRKSKTSIELLQTIRKFENKYSHVEFQQVDTLRKISKFKRLEESLDDQKNMFHWHFNIYNPTVENNFFKIDSFVWEFIFRKKVHRYDERIYKMSHYLINVFNDFKKLNYYDFENMNFRFENGLINIPINYKDKILHYNPTLSNELLLREEFSDFVYKKHTYQYRTETEREVIHLKKTFIRHALDNNKGSKKYLDLSRREEDTLYDELKDEELINKLNSQLNDELIQQDKSNFLFNLWISKYFGRSIELCEMEDRRRGKDEYNDNYIKSISFKNENNENIYVPRISEKIQNEELKRKLYIYRYNLENNSKAEKDYFINQETKNFYPDANVIMKRNKRIPLAEKIFKIKNV